MGHCCVVYNCCSNGFNDTRLKFFNLPSNPSRCYAWLKIIGRPELMSLSNEILSQLKVCSSHYKEIVFTEMVGARFYYEKDHPPLENKRVIGTEKQIYEDNALALALPGTVQQENSVTITDVNEDDEKQLTTYLPSPTGNISGIRLNNMFTSTGTSAFLDTNFMKQSIHSDLMLKRLYECIDPHKLPSPDFKTSTIEGNVVRKIEGLPEDYDHHIPILLSLEEAEQKQNFTEKAELPILAPSDNTVADMQSNSNIKSNCPSTSNLKEGNEKKMDSSKAVPSDLLSDTVPEEQETNKTENYHLPEVEDDLHTKENPTTVLNIESGDDKHNNLTGILQSPVIADAECEVKTGNTQEFTTPSKNMQPNEQEENDPFLILSPISPFYSPILSDQENGDISFDSAISLFPPLSFEIEFEGLEENPSNEPGIFRVTPDLNLKNLKQKEIIQNEDVMRTSTPLPEIKQVPEEKNSPEESKVFIPSLILTDQATKHGQNSPVSLSPITQIPATEQTENISMKSNIPASSPVLNKNVRMTRMIPKEPNSSESSPTLRTPGSSRKMKQSPRASKSSPRSSGSSNKKKSFNKSRSPKTSPELKTPQSSNLDISPSAPQRRRPKIRKASLGVRMFRWNSNFTKKVNKFQYKPTAYSSGQSPEGKAYADCSGVQQLEQQISSNSGDCTPENEECKGGPITPTSEPPERISLFKKHSDLPKKRSSPKQQDKAPKKIKLDNSNPGNGDINQNPHFKNVLSSEQNENLYASSLFASILQNIKQEHRTECIIEVLKIMRQYETK